MSISIICACKNREKALRVSLGSWILESRFSEIIIVDWSSDRSIADLTRLDSRIKVIRVEGQTWFNQPKPLNLASTLVTGEEILKLDCDHVLNPYFSFIDKYKIDDRSFVSGDHDIEDPYIAHSPYFKFLRGLLWVNTNIYRNIGGYNEHMGQFYAWEDSEIDIRLKMYGLSHRRIEYDHHFIHLPHSDAKRVEFFQGFGQDYAERVKDKLSAYYSGDQLQWERDYAVTIHHSDHNKLQFSNPNHWRVEPLTNWKVTEVGSRYYEAQVI